MQSIAVLSRDQARHRIDLPRQDIKRSFRTEFGPAGDARPRRPATTAVAAGPATSYSRHSWSRARQRPALVTSFWRARPGVPWRCATCLRRLATAAFVELCRRARCRVQLLRGGHLQLSSPRSWTRRTAATSKSPAGVPRVTTTCVATVLVVWSTGSARGRRWRITIARGERSRLTGTDVDRPLGRAKLPRWSVVGTVTPVIVGLPCADGRAVRVRARWSASVRRCWPGCQPGGAVADDQVRVGARQTARAAASDQVKRARGSDRSGDVVVRRRWCR